jgi:DnaJ family protein B protein 4
MGNFGGMGGMGGRQGMSHDDDDDDDDDEMNGGGGFSFGGMPGGIPRQTKSSSRSKHSSKPTEISRPLKISLPELYTGTVKRLKIGRRLANGTTEDKVLEIQIHPGWKSGTKIRFPKAGNETGGDAQDLVFVVEEKPHPTFTREGNDLICKLQIPLVDALTDDGTSKRTRMLEALDGRKLQIPVPKGIVKPGQESTLPGDGMPIRKDGSVKKKGDLIVKWDVVFPDRLTSTQKEGIRKALLG